MAYTAKLQLNKPAWKTLRFDELLNDNADVLDDAAFNFPGTTAPGTVGNNDEVVVSEGCPWRDTTNHEFKMRGVTSWETVLTSTGVDTNNASGSTDLSTWCDLIGATDACDPKYVIPVVIDGTTYYIPLFLTK